MLAKIKTTPRKKTAKLPKGTIVMLEITVEKIARKNLAAAHKIITNSKSKTKNGVRYFKLK
jgi:hypothetical protein